MSYPVPVTGLVCVTCTLDSKTSVLLPGVGAGGLYLY